MVYTNTASVLGKVISDLTGAMGDKPRVTAVVREVAPHSYLLTYTLRQGDRVLLRGRRESDIDDRLPHPIDPEEEDGYGSAWRREWDGRRYHTREYLTAVGGPAESGAYTWAVEYDSHCIGSARLRVDADQHCATYTMACSSPPCAAGVWAVR